METNDKKNACLYWSTWAINRPQQAGIYQRRGNYYMVTVHEENGACSLFKASLKKARQYETELWDGKIYQVAVLKGNPSK